MRGPFWFERHLSCKSPEVTLHCPARLRCTPGGTRRACSVQPLTVTGQAASGAVTSTRHRARWCGQPSLCRRLPQAGTCCSNCMTVPSHTAHSSPCILQRSVCCQRHSPHPPATALPALQATMEPFRKTAGKRPGNGQHACGAQQGCPDRPGGRGARERMELPLWLSKFAP